MKRNTVFKYKKDLIVCKKCFYKLQFGFSKDLKAPKNSVFGVNMDIYCPNCGYPNEIYLKQVMIDCEDLQRQVEIRYIKQKKLLFCKPIQLLFSIG